MNCVRTCQEFSKCLAQIIRQHLPKKFFTINLSKLEPRARTSIHWYSPAVDSPRRLASILLAQLIQSTPLEYRESVSFGRRVKNTFNKHVFRRFIDERAAIFFSQFYIAFNYFIIARCVRTKSNINAFRIIRQFASVYALSCQGIQHVIYEKNVPRFRNVIDIYDWPIWRGISLPHVPVERSARRNT